MISGHREKSKHYYLETSTGTFAKLPSPAISRKRLGHRGERTSMPVPKSYSTSAADNFMNKDIDQVEDGILRCLKSRWH